MLVLTNMVLLAIIWIKKDEAVKPQHGDARTYLVKNLSLNDRQVKTFDSLRQGHFEKMDESRRKLQFVKDRLFTLLSDKQNDSVKERLIGYLKEKIGELQGELDVETYNHFYHLRSALNVGQKQKFDSTIKDLLRNMATKESRPGGRLLPGNEKNPPN